MTARVMRAQFASEILFPSGQGSKPHVLWEGRRQQWLQHFVRSSHGRRTDRARRRAAREAAEVHLSGIEEMVADNAHHSASTLQPIEAAGVPAYFPGA
jgi:hypothetical protein